jgi:uncharacterized protein YodC (DUF2158 family)
MFYVGDKVRLKSGGPVMTVALVLSDYQTVRCHWFDQSGQLRNGLFETKELEKVE